MEVTENRELVDLASPFGRSKRHLELTLPAGVSYRVGDYLGILAENDPELVTRAARRFVLDLEEPLVIRETRAEKTALPLKRAISARELLTRYVELQAPATRRDIRTLAQHTACPPEKRALLALVDDTPEGREAFRTTVLELRTSVLDLLERFTACELPFASFLELLPEMQPRLYSIASSPLADPRKVSLTVALVEGDKWSGGGRYRGACSSYVAKVAPGDKVRGVVREARAPFRLPSNPGTPVIMIAAGSGIAPFRGFIEERAHLAARGETLGKALLFFGCDHPDVDFLYASELDRWRDVVDVFPAFFRKEENGVSFVQHRLWAERARVEVLLDRGAHVFVCGDGRRMAPAVRETIERIAQEHRDLTAAEARSWFDDLECSERYVADVFGG